MAERQVGGHSESSETEQLMAGSRGGSRENTPAGHETGRPGSREQVGAYRRSERWLPAGAVKSRIVVISTACGAGRTPRRIGKVGKERNSEKKDIGRCRGVSMSTGYFCIQIERARGGFWLRAAHRKCKKNDTNMSMLQETEGSSDGSKPTGRPERRGVRIPRYEKGKDRIFSVKSNIPIRGYKGQVPDINVNVATKPVRGVGKYVVLGQKRPIRELRKGCKREAKKQDEWLVLGNLCRNWLLAGRKVNVNNNSKVLYSSLSRVKGRKVTFRYNRGASETTVRGESNVIRIS